MCRKDKKASKDTLEKLAKDLSLAIKDVYPTIKDDIAVMEACDDQVSKLLSHIPELRMDLNFILVNLETSYYALITASHDVEKRFHIQNLWSDILESYKLLYGFGRRMRPHTIWARIGAELQRAQANTSDELYSLLLQVYDSLTSILVSLEPTMDDKSDRDLTYHYDDELLDVYDRILRAGDEEAVSNRLIDFTGLFRNMLLFSGLIELVEKAMGHVLPEVHSQDGSLLFMQRLFAEKLGERSDLQRALKQILEGVDNVDKAARVRKGIMGIKRFAIEKLPDSAFPEADDMDRLSNADLLLQYMLLEGASVTNAYLRAETEPAFPLMLRRLTITRVATLVHLFGYNESERKKALWTSLVQMIPPSADSLAEEAVELEYNLNELIGESDKDERALYVHLIENSTYQSNVPAIVSKIEAMNPALEIQKMNQLIRTTTRIKSFLKLLLDMLAADAHAQVAERDAKMRAQLETFRGYTKDPRFPEDFRDKFLAQMDEIEGVLNRIGSLSMKQ